MKYDEEIHLEDAFYIANRTVLHMSGTNRPDRELRIIAA
jgi:hypothetical protein